MIAPGGYITNVVYILIKDVQGQRCSNILCIFSHILQERRCKQPPAFECGYAGHVEQRPLSVTKIRKRAMLSHTSILTIFADSMLVLDTRHIVG